MPRVKRGLHHSQRRHNILQKAKGFEGKRKTHIKLAKTAITKAGAYAYADRRKKKRTTRANWNVNVNAAARLNDISYSKLMGALKKKNIDLNRKVLAQIAANLPTVFTEIVKLAKS